MSLYKQMQDARIILNLSMTENISVISVLHIAKALGFELPKLNLVECKTIAATSTFSAADIHEWFPEK